MAATKHERLGSDRVTDPAFVDQLAAGLDACSHEGVRGRADQHIVFGSRCEKLLSFFAGQDDGFLVVHMLACLDSLHRDGEVSLRRGEVDDDFDGGVRENLFQRCRLDRRIFFQLGCDPFGVEIGTGDHFNIVEHGAQVLEIDSADVSTSDDSDSGFLHGSILLGTGLQFQHALIPTGFDDDKSFSIFSTPWVRCLEGGPGLWYARGVTIRGIKTKGAKS